MEAVLLTGTESTPEISLNHNSHTLNFTGDSRPENVAVFYSTILKWMDDYIKYLYFIDGQEHPPINIQVNFKLEYFNSSSAKYILDALHLLTKGVKGMKNIQVTINWYYFTNDDDILETGQEYEKLVGHPFVFHEITSR